MKRAKRVKRKTRAKKQRSWAIPAGREHQQLGQVAFLSSCWGERSSLKIILNSMSPFQATASGRFRLFSPFATNNAASPARLAFSCLICTSRGPFHPVKGEISSLVGRAAGRGRVREDGAEGSWVR